MELQVPLSTESSNPSGVEVGVGESGTIPWTRILIRSMWVGVGVALTVAHFIYATEVGMEIFRRRGGFTDVGGGWTAIGGVESSWTPLVWLPAGVVFFLSDRFHLDPLAGVGVILALCGSIAAAVSSVMAFRAMCLPIGPRLGRYAWRLWLPGLLWVGWLPVPFEMTLTYWHTVKY
jgi:hypothetical protein